MYINDYNISMTDLVRRAYLFAKEKHKNQFMKCEPKRPFFDHCIAVYNHLIKNISIDYINFDVLVATALLHDVIEDTDASYEDLYKLFGQNVANNVLALTKNKNLPHNEQISESVDRLKKSSKEARLVKLADRYVNLLDIPPAWTEEKCLDYIKDSIIISEGLGYTNTRLKCLLDKNIENYIEMVEEIFDEKVL